MIDPVIQAAEQRQWSTVLAEVQQECIAWKSRALAAEAALAAERESCISVVASYDPTLNACTGFADGIAAAIRAQGE